ncbi:CrcB family protein [Citricoccus sp.]|uniref:CrcB family protein n=1 Tax=Citricoccus sp. TaxID=1978372 RepID=UPI0026121849|nr:CrcB family protein [Citricoccus sp.]HRO29483.1 CrcB family protein [Citricoccus sp.]
MSGRDPGAGRDQAPPRESLTAAMVLAVAAGGMAGTLARWLLVEVVPSPADSPVPGWLMLSVVNLLGAFLLGLLTARASRRPLPRWLRAGLGVGVLGSFTSLSAVVLAAALVTGLGPQAAPGEPVALALVALGVVAALAVSAALGTAAALAGLRAGTPGGTR